MQVLPQKEDLLDAVAFFLARQAAPSVSDPALAFRLRVAAHLIRTAAQEGRAETDQDAVELQTLTQLCPQDEVQDGGHRDPQLRQAQIRRLYAQLCDRIRSPETTDEELTEIRTSFLQLLASQLRIAQPKFRLDVSLDEVEE